MACEISIKEAQGYAKSIEAKKLVKVILEGMRDRVAANEPLKDAYGSYVTFLSFEEAYNRGLIGTALGAIWDYCTDYYLPWLNFLVVLKRQIEGVNIPGEAIQRWYEETFDSLKMINEYCTLQADLAEMALRSGEVVIGP